jgi:hypothetical protein
MEINLIDKIEEVKENIIKHHKVKKRFINQDIKKSQVIKEINSIVIRTLRYKKSETLKKMK